MKIIFVVPNLNFSGGIKVIKRHCIELNKLGHISEMWYPMSQYRGHNYPFSKCYFLPHQIPSADVIIATAWETATIVHNLDKKKYKRFAYFIQHYEQWEYHNGGEKKKEIEDTYSLPLDHIYVSRFISKHISPFDVNYIAHNGVDPQEIEDKDYSIPRILYPRREERWKGNETLDAALAMLRETYPGVEVRSYGQPVVDTKTLDQLFRWANIFVFPSWIEGFGLPPLEAASYGCAVISTTTNAMPEIFRNNEMLWCKPYDAECLYEGMKKLIKSSEERERLGTVACLKSRCKTPERSAQEFLDCLEY